VTLYAERLAATHTWGRAKIQEDLALLQKAIFLVQLNELEGGSGSVALLLGKLVPLVQATLAVLLLDSHVGRRCLSLKIQEYGFHFFLIAPPGQKFCWPIGD
jgi:hypothetical protein